MCDKLSQKKTRALKRSNANYQQLTNFDVASICRTITAACIPEESIVTTTSRTASKPARLIGNTVRIAEGSAAFRDSCFHHSLL